jgi:uncharacterized protein
MKFLTISDNVMAQLENGNNLRRNYGESVAVISCGDMPPYYLDYIISNLNVPLLYVRGNHDINYTVDVPGGDNLHGKVIPFKGLTFAGLEGCIRYSKEPIQYTDYQMYQMIFSLYPAVLLNRFIRRRRLDVLVTHAPLRGIHDLSDLPHRGFRSLHLAVRLFNPRYLIHGHVDTFMPNREIKTQLRQTTILNINPMKYLTIDV